MAHTVLHVVDLGRQLLDGVDTAAAGPGLLPCDGRAAVSVYLACVAFMAGIAAVVYSLIVRRAEPGRRT